MNKKYLHDFVIKNYETIVSSELYEEFYDLEKQQEIADWFEDMIKTYVLCNIQWDLNLDIDVEKLFK